jgi:host factor-I protein
MTIKNNNVQDLYLNTLRKEKVPVDIYLINGTRLRGVIKSFDNFVIVLKQEKQQLIFKHAIASIVPEREINITREEQSKE